MSLLPSRPDASPSEDAGPRVIGVDSDDADDVLAALSSGTARELLAALHEDPAPPSEVADRVGTSLQNAQYHLDKLQNAGAVEVVDTAYSAKGREMDVFAPADQPLVIFAGNEEKGSTLRTALARLLGAVGVLGLGSLAVQALFGQGGYLRDLLAGSDGLGGPAADGGGGADADVTGDSGGLASGDGDAGTTVEDAATDTATAAPEGGDGDLGIQEVTSTVTDAGGPDGAGTPTATPVDVSPTAAGTPTEAPVSTPPEPTMTPTVGPEEVDAVRTTVEAAGGGGLPPGLLFFAGGLFVLAVVVAVLTLSESASGG
ncbi:MAG: helix-turn-helix domain-containing protein [Haloarculaceae archaeon]